MNRLYEQGCAKAKEIIGETELNALIDNHKACAPSLSKFVIENVWGEIFSQEGTLTAQHKEMISVAVMSAIGGCAGPLKVHINGALNVGVTQEQIGEILTLVAALAGAPRALSAAAVVREVLHERKLN